MPARPYTRGKRPRNTREAVHSTVAFACGVTNLPLPESRDYTGMDRDSARYQRISSALQGVGKRKERCPEQ